MEVLLSKIKDPLWDEFHFEFLPKLLREVQVAVNQLNFEDKNEVVK